MELTSLIRFKSLFTQSVLSGVNTDGLHSEVNIINKKLSQIKSFKDIHLEHQKGSFEPPNDVQSWILNTQVPLCSIFADLFSALVIVMNNSVKGKEFAKNKFAAWHAN